jgi:RNA polymerase sigma-70 factor (ECF subfamily)
VAGDDPAPQYAARRRLEMALCALSPREQALVVLFELHGWSLAELSGVFDASSGSLKVRLHRARKKMRRVLEKAVDSGFRTARDDTKDELCVATKRGRD